MSTNFKTSILFWLSCILPCFGQLTVSLPPDAPPNYFVATNGTGGGTGRFANPISYLTLLTNITIPFKTNGAVFWIRGGTYSDLMIANWPINTLSATGITLRAYPGEAPVIRSGLSIGSPSNTIRGLNLWSPVSSLTMTDAYPGGSYSIGLQIAAQRTTAIGNNLVGHGDSVEAFLDSSNLLFYGNAVVASGVEYTNGGSSKHGHGIYMQNRDGSKVVTLNHIVYGCSDVATFHGTSAAYIQNIYFQSNFVAGSSSMGLITQPVSYDFEINRGDSTAAYGISNCWITDNFIIQDAHDGPSSALILGQEGDPPSSSSATNYLVHFDRNLYKGGFLALGDYDPASSFTVSSNLIWSTCASWASRVVTWCPTINYTPGSIDWNTWYYTGGNGHPWFGYTSNLATAVSITSLGQWQGFVHGESHSTYSASQPTAVITKVWPNDLRDAYDPWWGDVAIWNPQRVSNNVYVALSGLPTGTKIDVRYTGYLLGPSVLRTTYDGSGITIPMTNLPTYQPNDPAWPRLPQPTNGASFRVFLTQIGNGIPLAPASDLHTLPPGSH